MYFGNQSVPWKKKCCVFFFQGTFFFYLVEWNDLKQKLMRIIYRYSNVAINIDYLHESFLHSQMYLLSGLLWDKLSAIVDIHQYLILNMDYHIEFAITIHILENTRNWS